MNLLWKQLATVVLAAGLGFLLRRWGKVPEKLFALLHKVNTQVLLPVYLFLKVSGARLDGAADYSEAMLCIALALALALGGCLLLHKKRVPRAEAPVLLQCTLRGSSTLYTVALVLPLLGEAMQGYATVSVSLFSTFCNVGFIVLFSLYCKKGAAGTILKRTLLDPVLIAVAAALALCFCRVQIPDAVEVPLDAVSSLCAPLSFFLMGSMTAPENPAAQGRKVLALCALKLLALPAVGLALCALLGFEKQSLLLVASMLAAPVSASGFALAKHMGADAELAGRCTMLSSLVAPITVGSFLFFISIA